MDGRLEWAPIYFGFLDYIYYFIWPLPPPMPVHTPHHYDEF